DELLNEVQHVFPSPGCPAILSIACRILPSRRCVGSAEDCICPVAVDPKAPSPVNKPLVGIRGRNCGEMPQLSKLPGSARFGAGDSPRRKFLGPWCATNRRNFRRTLDRSKIMKLDASALEVRGLTKR